MRAVWSQPVSLVYAFESAGNVLLIAMAQGTEPKRGDVFRGIIDPIIESICRHCNMVTCTTSCTHAQNDSNDDQNDSDDDQTENK